MSERNRQGTTDPVQTPVEHSGPKGLAATREGLARSVWESVRDGATHFEQRANPPPEHPVRQFFHGLCLPFHLLRALWADPAARRRYLRVGLVQSLVIVALTITFYGSGNEAVEATRKRTERAERAERVEPAAPQGESSQAALGHFKLEVKAVAEEVRQEALEAAKVARAATGAEQRLPAQAGEQEPGAEKPGAEPPSLMRRIARALSFWAGLIAALQIAQWVVIALSREFHDAISRDASLLTAIEPEDPPLQPRVRLDLPWLRKEFSRRLRALKVFLAGMPLLYALSAPLPSRATLLSVLASLWSAYWLVVFTTAKSAHAWTNSDAGPPWFLRGWTLLTTRVPGFRWEFLQRYGRFWERQTQGVFAPAAELEKQPWAFAGLTLTRGLAMLPVAKCFLRPLIPVAAAHLLVARSAAERAAPSEPSAPPASPPAASTPAA